MSSIAIEIKKLSVQFGEHWALRDVTISVEKGEYLTILGPNGSGKSTLLKVLLGLVMPTSGEARLWGCDPCDLPSSDVGYVPQLKSLDRTFPALALELVVSALRWRWPMWIGSADRRRGLEALDRVGAGRLATRQISTLSGGELQRIYLARCFVHRPRLILLDEPATGIDAPGEADLYRILESYQRESGATILMITHDWEVAWHHAARVLLLNRAVVGYGSPRETMNDTLLRATFGHVGHSHGMEMGAAEGGNGHQHGHEGNGDEHGHDHDHAHGQEQRGDGNGDGNEDGIPPFLRKGARGSKGGGADESD